MKDLVPTIRRWQSSGREVALARVLSTWGSAPRRPGAWMGISDHGDIVGSVSGGCVEGAVRETALEILDGASARIVEFGIDNAAAWTVGLSCGGKLEVVIQRFPDSISNELMAGLESGTPMTWIFDLASGENELGLEVDTGAPAMEQVDTRIIQRIPRPPTIIIVGGADIAVHLVQLGHQAGFETVLIDPRSVFTDPDRFPIRPTRLHTKWPQEVLPELSLDHNSFAVLLTHDPKIDDPALALLFESDIRYIGALGGRKTQKARRERLASQGHTETDIARIHGPVGLKIGAATPTEIAISILAEIIEVKNSRG